jgi:hypothetical protein
MTFLKDLEKIKSKTAVFAFLGILLLIAPGAAIIFIFNYNLFLSLDISKLILLSVAIISPLIVINFTLSANTNDIGSDKDSAFAHFIFSIMISSVVIYVPLMMMYFSGSTLKATVHIISLIQLCFVVVGVQEYLKRKK